MLVTKSNKCCLLALVVTYTRWELTIFHGSQTLWWCRQSWAQCYGGHQFGFWAGQLGDGRAISLGEVTGPSGRYELQLKVWRFMNRIHITGWNRVE